MKKILLPLLLLTVALAGCDSGSASCPSTNTCVNVTNSSSSTYSINALGVRNYGLTSWNNISLSASIAPGETVRAIVNCGNTREMIAVYSDAIAYQTTPAFFTCGSTLSWDVTAH